MQIIKIDCTDNCVPSLFELREINYIMCKVPAITLDLLLLFPLYILTDVVNQPPRPSLSIYSLSSSFLPPLIHIFVANSKWRSGKIYE